MGDNLQTARNAQYRTIDQLHHIRSSTKKFNLEDWNEEDWAGQVPAKIQPNDWRKHIVYGPYAAARGGDRPPIVS